MLPTKLFAVTPDEIPVFRSKAEAAGVIIPEGNTGTITDTKDHVTLSFSYDGKDALSLTITDKPWYISADMIWSALLGYLS